jgi:CRP/FNR family transcriptional regulator
MNAPSTGFESQALRAALPAGLDRPPMAPAPIRRAEFPAPAPRLAKPWREALALLEQHVPFTRRMVHTGDVVHSGGELCTALHIVNSGMVRSVNFSADGREQVVGLHFKGDWLGFDGIATGRYGCDAIAMDTGEVWTFRYDTLLRVWQ